MKPPAPVTNTRVIGFALSWSTLIKVMGKRPQSATFCRPSRPPPVMHGVPVAHFTVPPDDRSWARTLRLPLSGPPPGVRSFNPARHAHSHPGRVRRAGSATRAPEDPEEAVRRPLGAEGLLGVAPARPPHGPTAHHLVVEPGHLGRHLVATDHGPGPRDGGGSRPPSCRAAARRRWPARAEIRQHFRRHGETGGVGLEDGDEHVGAGPSRRAGPRRAGSPAARGCRRLPWSRFQSSSQSRPLPSEITTTLASGWEPAAARRSAPGCSGRA